MPDLHVILFLVIKVKCKNKEKKNFNRLVYIIYADLIFFSNLLLFFKYLTYSSFTKIHSFVIL